MAAAGFSCQLKYERFFLGYPPPRTSAPRRTVDDRLS
jgi:hypothetical protein